MIPHSVRIGFAGEVFVAGYTGSLSRGRRVLVRTPRGVELGEVLGPIQNATPHRPIGLEIVRPTTENDERLLGRLNRFKVQAVRECQRVLSESRSSAMLLDVDQLFDGQTLILHFCGPADALGRELTEQIVRRYESEVRSIPLADLLDNGCGEGCGTAQASGCGGGCASCSLAQQCAPAAGPVSSSNR